MAIIQVNNYVNCVLKRRSGLIAGPTLYCGGIVAICQGTMQLIYHPFKLNVSFLNRMFRLTTKMLLIQTLFSVSTEKNIITPLVSLADIMTKFGSTCRLHLFL